MILKNIGTIVGYCGIEPFTLNGRKEYELGYRVVTKHRGIGIASEAAQLVANGFKSTLFAYVDAAITRSVNVLGKIGFIYQGTCILDSKEYELYKSSSDEK